MKSIKIFLIAGLLVMMAASCDKGNLVDEKIYAQITFQTLTVDPVDFKLFVEDTLVVTDLSNNKNVSKLWILNSKGLPVRVQQNSNGETISDMGFMPLMGTRNTHFFTVFQNASGEKPYVVLPPNDVPFPPNGLCKVKFTTRDLNLPEQMKLRFWLRGDLQAFDSCVLKRGEFTNWITMNISNPGKRIEYEAWDASTGKVYAAKKRFAFNVAEGSSGGLDIVCLNKSGSADLSILKLF